MIIKMISKIVAALMVVIFGSLYMVANGAAKVYCRIAGIFFNFIGICVLLAVITSQWNNVFILAIIAGAGFLSYLAVGLLMTVLESGKDFFKTVLHG